MIALILARGGSKGVPKKNIKILGEKPLIGHVIDSASKSEKISEIFVSTDSKEIAEISKKYGAKIIDRPSHLADDNSTDIESFIHALDFIPKVDEIIHLRATTPLIETEIINLGIDFYNQNKYICTSMRSGHELSESITKFYKLNDLYFKNLIDDLDLEYSNLPRQMTIKTFKPNGYIDIVKTGVFQDSKTFYGDKILAYITKPIVEIDTIEEFEYLEFLIKKSKKHGN
jgi:CMP-N-acetylneuraminic acid synthetase